MPYFVFEWAIRDLLGHSVYQSELDLSKFEEVVRRSIGHVHIDTQLFVAY